MIWAHSIFFAKGGWVQKDAKASFQAVGKSYKKERLQRCQGVRDKGGGK
jgi:hypothetical protein